MGAKKKAVAKTYEVRVTANALQNIDEITGYITFINHQPVNAIKLGDAIFETIDRIAASPYAFRECEELPTTSKMYRRAVCSSWSVIYKITGNEILVLGIIHHSRKPSAIKNLRNVK